MRNVMRCTIVLALVLCCVFMFVSCNTPNDTKPDDSNVSGGGGGDTGEQDLDVFEPYEGMDEVLYSHTRLENADFSFNFAMGNATSNASRTAMDAGPRQEIDLHEYVGKDLEFDIQPMTAVTMVNFFEDMEPQLERMRDQARSIVDFCIENITVTDKRVDFGMNKYVLSYDSQKDIIYVIANFNDTQYEIELFYNEDGYETVHMSLNNGYNVDELYYTPGQYYFLSRGEGNGYLYHVVLADKIDGEWQGLQYYYEKDNPYITHKGVYDYANGLIYVTFMFEKEGMFYTFGDHIAAYRDGYETGSGVEAQEGDVYVMQQYLLLSAIGDWLYDFNEPEIGIHDTALTGIDKICMRIDGYNEINSIQYGGIQYEFNNREKDYIVLSSGVKMHPGDVWHETRGWLSTKDGNYVDSKGEQVSYDEMRNGASVRFTSVYGTINTDGKRGDNCGLRFIPSGKTITEKTASLKKWMTANGLSFVDIIPPTILDDIAYLDQNNSTYRDKLFRHLYSKSYSAEVLVETMLGHASDIDAFPAYITEKLDSYEVINREDMPPKNTQNLQLVRIASDAKASVDATGIDMSAFTFEIPKSIVLFEGSTYGILAVQNNGIYDTACFTKVQYAGEDTVTLSGTDTRLQLPMVDGVNSIKLYFAKINDNGNIVPISNAVDVQYNAFETFEQTTPDDANIGGYYRYTYTYDAGEMKITSVFVDTKAPVIDAVFGEVDGVHTKEIFDDYSVYDLIKDLRIMDNVEVDYSTLTIKNKTTGEEITGDAIITPDTYIVEVKDTSGNVGSIELLFLAHAVA